MPLADLIVVKHDERPTNMIVVKNNSIGQFDKDQTKRMP
jgi:hypothetical protein